MFRLIVLSLVTLICGMPICAQFRFDSWTSDDGLPQNSVRGIAQTPDGYLWFTTLDGLVRFDGLRFKIFNKNNSPGLPTNRLFNLAAARDGSLWISSEKNDLIMLRNGVFSSVTAEMVPGNSIFGFTSDASGNLLVETPKGKLAFRDGAFEIVEKSEDDGSQKNVLYGRSGTKWTVLPHETIEETNGTHRVYRIDNEAVSYYDGSTFEDSRGALWIGDMGRLWNLKDGKAVAFSDPNALPPDTRGHRFWEEPDGSIWFATGGFNLRGVGLVRFKDGKFSRFGTESGLSNDRILAVFRDREGTTWLATDKGLNRLRSKLITPLSAKDGPLNEDAYPILRLRDGSVMIGVSGGVAHYRDRTIEEIPLRFAADPASTVAVQSLAEEATGKVWIGVVGGVFVLEKGKIRDVTKIIGSNPTIWTIRLESDGSVMLGTERDGVVTIKGETIVKRITTSEGLPSNDVKFIHRSDDGTLWFGTYGGLSRYRNGEFTHFTTANGLSSNSVRFIKEDADGALWIGTYDGGISRFLDDKFFTFSTRNGLFSDGAFAIVEDQDGRFWISSNQGIYSVAKADLNAVADGFAENVVSYGYGKQDGMPSIECNGGRQPAAMTDEMGRIWFPTVEGVAIVDPIALRKNSLPPPVAVESVEIDRQPVASRELVELGPEQTQLDIVYTGLSFIKPEQIRFRYKLEGLDNEWIDAGTRRSVSYTRLPAGEYTFTVIAANSDGIWNDVGRSVKVSVAAPFYRTLWFSGLVVLLVVGVGFVMYASRISSLKHRNREQEAFSRQLIESQEAERKRIAQEIHDGLGQSLLVIKNRATMGLAAVEKTKADEQFDEIRESVTDALGEVRVISQNLRPLHLERLGLTSTLEEMIEQLDAASDIEINYDIEPIDGRLSAENEMNLYRIAQECLNNVVKHSEATTASVSAFIEDGRLLLTIRDNGRGFDREKAAERRGLGLSGIAERVKILDGTLSIDSEVGKGTSVTINIPV